MSRGRIEDGALLRVVSDARVAYETAHHRPSASDDAETLEQYRARLIRWDHARDVAIARGVLALVEDAGALPAGDGAPFRVCVAALVTDPRGRVALVQGKRIGLELPGGKVRPGEPWIEAIAREVFEETALIPSFEDRPLWVLHAGIADGLTCESAVIVYRGTVSIEHPLTPGGDATDARWYAPDDLPGLANLPSARRLREWAAGQTERPALSRAEVRPDHDARAAGARMVERALMVHGPARACAESIALRMGPAPALASEHLVGAADRLREIASELVGLAAERGPA